MVEVLKVEDLVLGKHIGDYDIDVYDAIIVPKGMTNFEVLKELFPNIEFKENKVHRIVYGADRDEKFAIPKMEMEFNMNWLNKEYKGDK